MLFFYLSEPLFSSFIQINFVRGQSKVMLHTSRFSTQHLRCDYMLQVFLQRLQNLKLKVTQISDAALKSASRVTSLPFVCLLFSEQKGYKGAYIKETCMIEGLILYLSLLCFNFRWRQLMTARKCKTCIGTARTVLDAVDVHAGLG